MKISLAIMAHPKRREAAESLYAKTKNMDFSSCVIVWDKHNDEWSTGTEALRAHDTSDYHVIIQDDAILSEHFRDNIEAALSNVPERTLVSFYTGRVRPYPFAVSKAINEACSYGASWLKAPTLLWGVAIAIPIEDIEPMLQEYGAQDMKYDRRIGWYFMQRNRPVLYTYPSLVDHDYRLGSLIGNDYALSPRIAHRYVSTFVAKWNRLTVAINARI